MVTTPASIAAAKEALRECIKAFELLEEQRVYVLPHHPMSPKKLAREALAALAAQEDGMSVRDGTEERPYLGSLCAQCGPDVYVDDEGCCASCGLDAVGDGADEFHRVRRERDELAQAVGLMTTVHPDLVMNADAPLEMARDVVAYVAQAEKQRDEAVRLLGKARDDLIFYATLTETHVGKPHDAYAEETAAAISDFLATLKDEESRR